MSQSLPVLTGSGSLLSITESPQSTLVAGVKGVSSESGFSTVMSQTAVQQKGGVAQQYDSGGDALPSEGTELPLNTVQGDGRDRLNDNYVAASMAEGPVPPSQTVEQIERFLAVELNVEQSRSEFSRPDVVKSFMSFDLSSQGNNSPNALVSAANSGVEQVVPASLPSISAEAGLNQLAAVSEPEALYPGMSSFETQVKVDSVVSEHLTGRPPQVVDVLQGAQRDSVAAVKQSPVQSSVNEPILQTINLAGVKASYGNEREMLVSNAAPASNSLAQPSGFVESSYTPQQGEGWKLAEQVPATGSERGENVSAMPLFPDSVEQMVPVISTEERVNASAIPLAAVPVVGATVAGDRQKQTGAQPVGGERGVGTSLSEGVNSINAQEGESNNSLSDKLTRLQSAAASQAGQLQFQKDASLSAVDKAIQDKGGVEHKNESFVETLAASIAATTKTAKPQSDVYQLQMPNGVKPGMQAWNQAVNERIVLLSSQNGHVAEIQLDPPELGSLQVKLQVKNDQVSVIFSTPHGAVRDALEQGLPRLREMFAEQGLSLTESSVEDQTAGQNREGSSERQNASSGHSGFDEEVDGPITAASQREGLSLVDYYA